MDDNNTVPDPTEITTTDPVEPSSTPPVVGATSEEQHPAAEPAAEKPEQEQAPAKEATPPLPQTQQEEEETQADVDVNVDNVAYAPNSDDEDDDYDPESIYQSSISQASPAAPTTTTTTTSNPSKVASQASQDLLQSVLNDFAPQAKQPSASQSQAPVDLGKLLSSIGATKSSSSSSSPSVSAPQKLDPSVYEPHPRPDIDAPFTPEENQDYQKFLDAENQHVKEGRWDQFPYGSRMFVGNLPVAKISKQQLYRIFRPYGELAQISIKQAYGFVQYLEPEHCARAMQEEAKHPLKGSRLNMEISKPQIPKRERERQRELERQQYRERGGGGGGERNRHHNRDRERSRSPDRNGRRNSHGNNRNNNRRGGNNRNSQRDYSSGANSTPLSGRGQQNSHHQQQRGGRQYGGIPECQILVVDQVDPMFVQYVEGEMQRAGLRVAVDGLYRDDVKTAVQKYAFDGVMAVVLLTFQCQQTSMLDIQVFDRSGPNVRFDEYLQVDLQVATELVNRAKRMSHYQPPPPPPPQQNLAGTLQQMDPNALQQMMQYLQTQQGMQAMQMPQMNMAPQQQQPQQPPPSMANNNQQGQSTQQVQNIMDQLARLQNR